MGTEASQLLSGAACSHNSVASYGGGRDLGDVTTAAMAGAVALCLG